MPTSAGPRSLWLVKALGQCTLTLSYAVTIADLVLAPFTPSNTARSGGTVFPVIRNLPGLYDSKPNDPSSRKIGGYLMWVAIASTCVTSSMFLTALAPNLLAVELINKTAKVSFTWMEWFSAFAPDAHLDPSAAVHVFRGVAQQVHECLGQSRSVAQDDELLLRQLDHEAMVAFVDERARRFDGLLQFAFFHGQGL